MACLVVIDRTIWWDLELNRSTQIEGTLFAKIGLKKNTLAQRAKQNNSSQNMWGQFLCQA
jgi:hypothetical protein